MSVQAPIDSWEVVAVAGNGSRRSVQLRPGKNVFVGSSKNCGLQLSGDSVSELQCLLMLDEQGVSIQDWASKSGTHVNGTAIAAKTQIQCGDRISIGEYSLTVQPAGGATSRSAQADKDSATATATPQQPASEAAAATQRIRATGPQPISHTLSRPSIEASADSTSDAGETAMAGELDSVLASIRAKTGESAEPDLQTDGTPADVAEALKPNHQEAVEPEVIRLAKDSDTPTSLEKSDQPTDGAVSDADFAMPEDRDLSGDQNSAAHDPFEFDDSLFEADSFDQETVQLLRAEIEDLQAALVQRDAQIEALQGSGPPETSCDESAASERQSEALLERLQDLLDEAECHDERVACLEDLLQTAEEANRAEQEERAQLESWVADIEQRIGERENEWRAEVESLRLQVQQTAEERDRVQHHLRSVAKQGGEPQVGAPDAYQETLDRLQEQNRALQQELEAARKETAGMQQKIERGANQDEQLLRQERAAIARDRAEISRLRFELQQKMTEAESLPVAKDQVDREFAGRLRTLREHLKEIHEEERQERAGRDDSSLSNRISKLWKRLES